MRQDNLMSVEFAGLEDTFPDSSYLEVLIFHQIPEKEENKTKEKKPETSICWRVLSEISLLDRDAITLL